MPPQFVASSQIPVAQCEVGRSCSHWQLQLVHTRALSLLSLSKSPTSWARHRTFKLLARWRGPRSRPALEATDALLSRRPNCSSRPVAQRPASQGPSWNPGGPGPTSGQWPPGQGHVEDLRRRSPAGEAAAVSRSRCCQCQWASASGPQALGSAAGRGLTRLPSCPSLAMGRRMSAGGQPPQVSQN